MGVRKAGPARRKTSPKKRAPESLQDPRLESAQAFLSAVVESSDDAIITKNLEGMITSWNRAAERIFGYKESEVKGKHISILIPAERLEEENEIISRIRRGVRVEHFETVRRAKDGRLLDLSITVSPIRNEHGVVIGASKIARDITDRRVDERRRRFLTDATASFSLSLDFESTVRSIVKVTVPAIADFSVLDLIRPDDKFERVSWANGVFHRSDFDEISRYAPPRFSPTHPVSRAFASGASVLVPAVDAEWIESMAISPEHARFLQRIGLQSVLTVLLMARGKTLGALTLYMAAESGRHHTRENVMLAEEFARRASEALENALLYRDAQNAVAEREKFLSIASHELKTPLTTLQLQLQGAIRMLRRKDPGAVEKSTALVENAEKQGMKIGKLVNELLDITQITSGKLRIQPESVDLSELARSVADHFSPELTDKGIALEVRAPEPVRGRWDRFRLDQVLTNLISNAIKYGNSKPITISVDNAPKVARMVVKDQGAGMEPSFLKRIFNPFEQGEPTGQHGGLGLGLFITRQIVESHGGKIAVTSRQGEGSMFTIELPRE
jgi:PAS domain S-box-containing protein